MFSKVSKLLALAVATTLMVTVVAGCGAKTEEKPKADNKTAQTTETKKDEPKPAEAAKVTFMTWESQTMNQAILDSFKGFTEKNPNIKVELIPSPLKDYGTKLNQMLAANEAPDVFQSGNDMCLANGEQGLLYDWTSYAAKESGFEGKFYPGVIDNWKVNGKLYGLPGLLNCYGVFYNKKLLKEAGVPEPKSGWTVKDMLDAAKKLAKPAEKRYGLNHYGFDAFTISMYAVSMGGEPYADGISKVTKVQISQQFKDVTKMFIEAMKDGSVQPNNYNSDNLDAQFMEGKVAMLYHGQWHADGFIRNAPKDLEWGYAPNPIGTKQSTIYDAVGYTSPAKIKNPAAVWEVLKYMDSTTYEIVLPTTPVAPAAFTSASQPYYNKLKQTGHQDLAEALEYMLKSPDKQPVRFQTSWAGDANKFMDAEWNNILSGKTPIEKLDEIAKNVNSVIAKNK